MQEDIIDNENPDVTKANWLLLIIGRKYVIEQVGEDAIQQLGLDALRLNDIDLPLGPESAKIIISVAACYNPE
jgi:hypothetical protein